MFDLHDVRLVRTARLLVDDMATAEDVVMDAFTSLHRRWETLRDPSDAHRYLRSCVLNGARSQLRRRRVRRLHDDRWGEPLTAPMWQPMEIQPGRRRAGHWFALVTPAPGPRHAVSTSTWQRPRWPRCSGSASGPSSNTVPAAWPRWVEPWR